MTILDKINANKLIEIEVAKAKVSVEDLESSVLFDRKCISLRDAILNKSGIIAEFKRQSPSKGVINGVSKPEDVAIAYEKAGVKIAKTAAELWKTADIISKVRPPEADEVKFLKKGKLLISFFYPAQNTDQMALIAKPAATKDAMKLEGVKLTARLTGSWSIRRRDWR